MEKPNFYAKNASAIFASYSIGDTQISDKANSLRKSLAKGCDQETHYTSLNSSSIDKSGRKSVTIAELSVEGNIGGVYVCIELNVIQRFGDKAYISFDWEVNLVVGLINDYDNRIKSLTNILDERVINRWMEESDSIDFYLSLVGWLDMNIRKLSTYAEIRFSNHSSKVLPKMAFFNEVGGVCYTETPAEYLATELNED